MSFAATVVEPREFLLLFDLDGVLVIKNLHHQKLPNPVNTEVYRRECLSGLSFYVRPNLNQFFQDLREKVERHCNIKLVLGVWSSMQRANVERIVGSLEDRHLTNVHFDYVLSRSECLPAPTVEKPYMTVKSLNHLNVQFRQKWLPDRVMIVDNEIDKLSANEPQQGFLFPEFIIHPYGLAQEAAVQDLATMRYCISALCDLIQERRNQSVVNK